MTLNPSTGRCLMTFELPGVAIRGVDAEDDDPPVGWVDVKLQVSARPGDDLDGLRMATNQRLLATIEGCLAVCHARQEPLDKETIEGRVLGKLITTFGSEIGGYRFREVEVSASIHTVPPNLGGIPTGTLH